MDSKNGMAKNSINTLRFFAAFRVMWGHMTAHLNVSGGVIETISSLLQYFMGVPLFFFISGYLIRVSIEKSKDGKEYFMKRFLRIYPELWGGVIIEILTILIFYKWKMEWAKLGVFAVTQATIFQFWTPEFLRGYGCGTPNGSLWTIGVTVQFYILAWLTRRLWINRGSVFWIALTIIFMMIGACTGMIEGWLPIIVYKLYCQTITQYLWIFWLGIVVAECADKLLSVLKKYWWVCMGVYIVWSGIGIDVYARNFPIFATVICCFGCLAMAYAFPKLNIKTDISYSMFIYHMIFVNIMIAVGWTEMKGLIIVTVLTLLSACLSTLCHRKMYFMEKTL